VTIVISCTVWACSWYLKWGYAWNVNEWFTAVGGLIFSYVEKWKPFW